ncbi:30S ribosomal protein S8e [Candidatus Mancarchaeum acidiphilum]|uniref:30S ribosomal protein S8e n=1 Tax=Candidatus Mancarchaeum acidiphilum TaxID=1920749 RepID=A0A218NNL3_9ARCH|nr:30S ribosomal protein S8e [Candidatus Mancarchaeum acidiphilum]ASI14077.1 30S ribosomal protein S8e [Candidatus Mancarchaeum acidiphilum]
MSLLSKQMHSKSKTIRTGSGKRKVKFRDKKRYEIGNYFISTKMSEEDVRVNYRGRGGKITSKLKKAATANVLTKEGYKKAKIKVVVESKDNRNFARLNTITKGTIINTDVGKAVVLNRPGREGFINAKLLDE